MQTLRIITVIAFLALTIPQAGVPVQDFTPTTIGLEYTGIAAGQLITQAQVPSHYRAHLLKLAYAPAPWIIFSAGAGIGRFDVDEYRGRTFDGNPGLSAVGGITLATPKLADFLGFTLGFDGYYFSSERKEFVYSGFLFEPFLGILFFLGDIVDLEAGVKAHIIDGNMQAPGAAAGQAFSNEEIMRGYAQVTFHSRENGAYLVAGLDASQKVQTDLSKGPYEATAIIKLGILLRQENLIKKTASDTMEYFPKYEEMQKRQKKMAGELD